MTGPELLLPSDTIAKVEKLQTADLVVGIASDGSQQAIANAVRTLRTGLAGSFPSVRAVIVNSAESFDGVQQVDADISTSAVPVLQVATPLGLLDKLTAQPGLTKARAIGAVLQVARRLAARACAIVDSDPGAVGPDWVRLLLTPVLEDGFDYVAPRVARHKYDGTITSGIVYPLMRSLFGLRVRRTLPGDFSFSSRLVEHLLGRTPWTTETSRLGLDIWLTSEAMVHGFRLCQVSLREQPHARSDQGQDLSETLAEVVGALFALMGRTTGTWQKVRGSTTVPTFGASLELDVTPVEAHVGRMMDSFRLGLQALSDIWSLVLSPAAMLDLRRAVRLTEQEFRLADELWVHIIHDFAIAYRYPVIPRDQLLHALTPTPTGSKGPSSTCASRSRRRSRT
jgi:hypothetical protein